MADFSTFDGVFQFIINHGYLFLLIIMIFEGPVVTIAASFASSLGYFDIWIIFILAPLGDIIGDILMYAIGYYARKKILREYNHIFKIKSSWIKNLEKHFKNHLGKTLLTVKLTPLAVPGLILAGASRVNLKRYAKWCIIIIVPKTLFFVFLGYSFGAVANSILGYYKNTNYALLFIIIFSLCVYWLSRKISEKILKSSRINMKNNSTG